MKKLCVIPARGGSKRIPRKNIKYFQGKPILSYSIKAALESGLFDEVMVSTDDVEIADVAKKYGAKVPFFRSIENSNDYATTVDVLNEVMQNYVDLDREFDAICCLYPTAPFVLPKHLKEGFEKLRSGNFSSVFAAVSFSYPIWRGLKETDNGKVEMIWPEFLNTRSQDMESTFHDAGQWYWFRPERIIKEGSLFTNNSSFIILDELEAQDIDNETDWKIAELKYELLRGLK